MICRKTAPRGDSGSRHTPAAAERLMPRVNLAPESPNPQPLTALYRPEWGDYSESIGVGESAVRAAGRWYNSPDHQGAGKWTASRQLVW